MEQDTQALAIREDQRFIGTPEALGELFAALAAAQGEFAPVVKDSQANVQMKSGGNYKFDYAGLDVVIAATQPALSRHGLAFMQLLGEESVTTVLAKGGARIVSTIFFAGTPNAQEFGSKVTYLKRYARLSILSVFPVDEDDDANTSIGNQAAITKRTSPNPPAVAKAEPPRKEADPNALTPLTKARIGDLGKAVGFNREELEAFAIKHKCGALASLNEVTGLLLVTALDGLKVQP